MKKYALSTLIVLSMYACQKSPNKNQLMHDEAAKHKDCYQNVEFAHSVDFICNMQLSLGISDTAHYKGKVYGFCSKFCKQDFSENEEFYLAKIDQ